MLYNDGDDDGDNSRDNGGDKANGGGSGCGGCDGIGSYSNGEGEGNSDGSGNNGNNGDGGRGSDDSGCGNFSSATMPAVTLVVSTIMAAAAVETAMIEMEVAAVTVMMKETLVVDMHCSRYTAFFKQSIPF